MAQARPHPAEAPPPRAPAAPFIKWAGGKGALLAQYEAMALFASVGSEVCYHEPFLGGGAVFFRLQPGRAHLSDVNAELINAYRMVKDRLDDLLLDLAQHLNDADYFYALRAKQPGGLTTIERASRFIYLNRTCFNGLYRVNSRGVFNVPFGRYKNPDICREEALRAARDAMRRCDLRLEVASFQNIEERSAPGDFVYFDPPYVPLSPTAKFTQYNADNFGESAQRDLAATCGRLHRKGVKVLLSNSDAPLVHELYGQEGFHLHTVMAPRLINRDADKRGLVREIVACNFPIRSLPEVPVGAPRAARRARG